MYTLYVAGKNLCYHKLSLMKDNNTNVCTSMKGIMIIMEPQKF